MKTWFWNRSTSAQERTNTFGEREKAKSKKVKSGVAVLSISRLVVVLEYLEILDMPFKSSHFPLHLLETFFCADRFLFFIKEKNRVSVLYDSKIWSPRWFEFCEKENDDMCQIWTRTKQSDEFCFLRRRNRHFWFQGHLSPSMLAGPGWHVCSLFFVS